MTRLLAQIGVAGGWLALIVFLALMLFGAAPWAVAIFGVSLLVWLLFAPGALLTTLLGVWLGSR